MLYFQSRKSQRVRSASNDRKNTRRHPVMNGQSPNHQTKQIHVPVINNQYINGDQLEKRQSTLKDVGQPPKISVVPMNSASKDNKSTLKYVGKILVIFLFLFCN